MSSQYKGFRIWNLEFQAMQEGATGVTKELDSNNNPTGRLLCDNNIKYYTEDDIGLACHLRDFLQKMCDSSENGVGWSLDDDLYSELYTIVQSGDVSYSDFINKNQNIYHPTLNPTGETTVKLATTEYTRAMFFKHSTGHKAMIGLSLYASGAAQNFQSFTNRPSYSLKVDPGFYKGCRFECADRDLLAGGLFISVIPPANQGGIDYRFSAERDISDSGFLPPTATPVVSMMYNGYYSSSGQNNYPCCSWLKTGTSTSYDAGSSSGILVGTNMKLSLLLDSKGCIGISYKYTASQNTTSLKPMILVGPLYKSKVSESDTLCTSKLGISLRNIYLNPYTNYYNSSHRNSAWLSYDGSSYRSVYFSNYSNYSNTLFSFSEDASSITNRSIYTAYPALNSGVYLNYRYAKSGYTPIGFIDEDIFRWTKSDGLVEGQTYNDGEWCYIGQTSTEGYLTANNMSSSTSDYMYASIRWDSAANGSKTFA